MSQRRCPRIWCRPRLEILEARLPPGDILFDIGITVNGSDQPVATEAEVLVGLRFPGHRSWDDSNDLAHVFTGGVAWEPWRRARGSARPLKPTRTIAMRVRNLVASALWSAR